MLSFVFTPVSDERRRRLVSAIERLPTGGEIVIVDHNAPRRAADRWLATAYVALGRPLLDGSSAGDRMRHSAARELQDLGLEVVALRLLAGELFQAVVARKSA